MTKTIIMWSGGADSTCVVDQMLRNTDDELVLCHILFTNTAKVDQDNPLRLKHNVIKSAQQVAIKQIAAYWKKENYRPFTLDIMHYSFPLSTPHGSHNLGGPFMGSRAVRNHEADRYMTGLNPITYRDHDAKKKLETYESLFDLLVAEPVSVTQVWDGLDLPGTKAKSLPSEKNYSHVKWEKPLAELGWGKLGVAKRLPPELKSLVVSCDNPTTHGDHWERCGECYRCSKWEQVVRQSINDKVTSAHRVDPFWRV